MRRERRALRFRFRITIPAPLHGANSSVSSLPRERTDKGFEEITPLPPPRPAPTYVVEYLREIPRVICRFPDYRAGRTSLMSDRLRAGLLGRKR